MDRASFSTVGSEGKYVHSTDAMEGTMKRYSTRLKTRWAFSSEAILKIQIYFITKCNAEHTHSRSQQVCCKCMHLAFKFLIVQNNVMCFWVHQMPCSVHKSSAGLSQAHPNYHYLYSTSYSTNRCDTVEVSRCKNCVYVRRSTSTLFSPSSDCTMQQ